MAESYHYEYSYNKPKKKANLLHILAYLIPIVILLAVLFLVLPRVLPQDDSLNDGLVLWYDFENVSDGVVYDKSGNGYDGILMPNGTDDPKWVDGRFGKALEFDGVDDWVDLGAGNFVNGSSVTLSYWFKINEWGGYGFDDNRGVASYFRSSGLRNSVYNGNETAFVEVPSSEFRIGIWYHSVTIYDGSLIRQYINGKQIGEVELTGNISYQKRIACIGQRDDVGDSYFSGEIDGVKIWNRALNGKEIKELYTGKVDITALFLLLISFLVVVFSYIRFKLNDKNEKNKH